MREGSTRGPVNGPGWVVKTARERPAHPRRCAATRPPKRGRFGGFSIPPRPGGGVGMSFLPGPELWGRLLGILLIDLVLAGDNAVVIALAVRDLPANVKTLGAIWGTVGAIVLRIACAFAATVVLRLPGAQVLAAALLL